MTLIDIGANLTHDSFDADRAQVIARAVAAGVEVMIVTGASEQGSLRARDLARDHPGVLYATAGVHPHHAADYSADTVSVIAELLADDLVRAGGECGLDYFRDFSPRPAQRRAFELQLELAAGAGKPVFLHQRDAHEDFIAILKNARPALAAAVVHCFTGDERELADYLALDCHIGITGWISDERRGAHLKEIVRLIPQGRLMLETDAPYLKPRDLRPRVKTHRNEPQWLPWIARTVAACRGETPQAVARHTTATAKRFFALEALTCAGEV